MKRHVGRAQQPPDLVERTDRTEHVGNMVQDEQLRPFPERPSDLLHHAPRLPSGVCSTAGSMPCSASGRMTALCSKPLTATFIPGLASAWMAMLSACVAFV